MVCPDCKTDNPPGSPRCRKCNASLDVGPDAATATGSGAPTTVGADATGPDAATATGSGAPATPRGASIAAGWSIPPRAKTVIDGAVPITPATPLEPGGVLGGRYEILQLLG